LSDIEDISSLLFYQTERYSFSNADNLDELRKSLKKILNKLTLEDITSLTKWQFIVEGLSVANI
jgi:hypothetical protein